MEKTEGERAGDRYEQKRKVMRQAERERERAGDGTSR